MQRMLNRFRNDLSVAGAAAGNGRGGERARLRICSRRRRGSQVQGVDVRNGRLEAVVSVENLGGHKLPTAYPSRRAWLHVTVRDRNGPRGVRIRRAQRQRLDSGQRQRRGRRALRTALRARSRARIRCRSTSRSWPAPTARVTTGLLTARALREGQPPAATRFRQAHGRQGHRRPRRRGSRIADFAGGGDRDPLRRSAGRRAGAVQVDAELWYQPIAYPLGDEPQRRTTRPSRAGSSSYYNAMAGGSGVWLAHATLRTE